MALTYEPKTLTVRLAPDLYQAATEIARKREVSLNALIQESLAATIRIAEEQARYEAYTELGKDLEMCDMEYAIYAQAEVMLRE